MPKFKDLTNMQFSKWKVLYRAENKCNRVVWHCKCECNREFDVLSCHLLSGNSVQCRVCADTKGNGKHGDSGTRFYRIWEGMKNRCTNPTASHYKDYGGRGISYFSYWGNYENFKKDMYDSYLKHVFMYGEQDTTLDRINNDGNYEPNNCRWATKKEQSQNTRRNIKISEGVNESISELS